MRAVARVLSFGKVGIVHVCDPKGSVHDLDGKDAERQLKPKLSSAITHEDTYPNARTKEEGGKEPSAGTEIPACPPLPL